MIKCDFSNAGDIRVFGATSKEQATEAAKKFLQDQREDSGLEVSFDQFAKWTTPGKAPKYWEDHHVFLVVEVENILPHYEL